MSNRGKISYVFASSNTRQGFYTFIPELIGGLEKVYILKGAAGSGKSTFIRLIGETLSEQGYEVEFWISATDPITPDGVYIPQLQTAVVNGSLPQPVDPQYPAAWEIIINLDEYRDKENMEQHRGEIRELVNEFQGYCHKAGLTLKNAAQVKEQIKKMVSGHLNMKQMERLVLGLVDEIMKNLIREQHYFASAVTPDGVVNYVDEISSHCRKRYIFRGPPGSGKSTIINEIACRAKQHGCSLEYYHCGLDVDSITMVILHSLQIALIDAGDIQMAAKPGDIIIDMTSFLDDYDMDIMETQVSEGCRNFETLLLQAQTELGHAGKAVRELKKIYAAAMDFEMLDQKREEVLEQITLKTARW